MARVRIRTRSGEIEIDSRDFYVDNGSMKKIVEEMAVCLEAAAATAPTDTEPLQSGPERTSPIGPDMQEQSSPRPAPLPAAASLDGLGDTAGMSAIRDAEDFEPEFSHYHNDGPVCDAGRSGSTNSSGNLGVPASMQNRALLREQARDWLLQLLDADTFFDSPRTVSDITRRFRERGWHAAGSLAVSEALVDLRACKKIAKNPSGRRGGFQSTYYRPGKLDLVMAQ